MDEHTHGDEHAPEEDTPLEHGLEGHRETHGLEGHGLEGHGLEGHGLEEHDEEEQDEEEHAGGDDT